MSGSVTKRKCFYEKVDGTIRPYEWAVVYHSELGKMVEPYWPFANNTTAGNQGSKLNDDFTSEFQRVDDFVQTDDAGVINALNDGTQETWMHGGRNYPRSGR